MSPDRIARSAAKTFVAGVLAFGALGASRRIAPDCTKIDVTSAAKVLGVPKTRDVASGRHTKQPPNNMDVLGCGYVEVTHDPIARTLLYWIYTPIAKDLEGEFSSLSNGNVPGEPQKFSPGVGGASTGWVRRSVNGETFDGGIVVRAPTYIAVAKIAGMPNTDALQKALINAGQILVKP